MTTRSKKFKEGDLVISTYPWSEDVQGLGKIVRWEGEIKYDRNTYYVRIFSYKHYAENSPDGEDNHPVSIRHLEHATKLHKALY